MRTLNIIILIAALTILVVNAFFEIGIKMKISTSIVALILISLVLINYFRSKR